MDRTLFILIAILISSILYGGIYLALRRPQVRRFVGNHSTLHPNAICVWRLFIGLLGILLYFLWEAYFLGILFFTFSAFLDGVDGLVARQCDLITRFGEEIDPLCDKLTYLPPMVIFAYLGMLPVQAVWVLVGIEFAGQFLVRYILKRFTQFSVQANNFGKIKAVLCFAIIIYCAILEDSLKVPKFTTQLLYLCIIMSGASIVFKTIPNRFYADILSLLNLVCGILGIGLVLRGHYVLATLAVLAGQVFDLFDGRMAQKHGGTKFGPWFDDIADLTSFGLCPALLILMLGKLKLYAMILAALYFFAVAYRLLRFLIKDKMDKDIPYGTFNGLPSPAGALVALGTALFWKDYWVTWVVICMTSYLLISHIRFVHFGRIILPWIPRVVVILTGFLILLVTAYLIKVRDPRMLGGGLLALFLVYVVVGSHRVATWIMTSKKGNESGV